MSTGKRAGRIPALDGLRVWMIFIVSWFHIWQQSWLEPGIRIGETWISLDFMVRSGYVWVDATILLSAFLLYLPYARKKLSGSRNPGGIQPPPADAPVPESDPADPLQNPRMPFSSNREIRDFYFRKAKRILPAYWFIILAFFLFMCLPWNLYYGNGPYIVKDLFTHFTLIFPFWQDTYMYTPLGAASWTLSVVAQGYLFFPLLARWLHRRPAVTLCVLAGGALAFRSWCLWGLQDVSMVVNTFVNFLDVYALGFACALLYAKLEHVFSSPASSGKSAVLVRQILATLLFIGSVAGVLALQRVQSGASGHPNLQRTQMILRLPFALGFAGMILSAPFSLKPLRKLLGNRVTAFLASVSMNYYLVHQTLAVHMRRIGFPASRSETPNMELEQPWQTQYTLLAFGLSLLAAVLITYLVEKPIGKWLEKKKSA